MTKYLLALWLLLPARVFAQQQCSASDVCVARQDIMMMVQLAREAQCRSLTDPLVNAEPISIVLDRQGRVFGSGTGDKPFRLRMEWCNYEIETESQIKVIAAQRVEPVWGFRFRAKVAFGVLTRELFKGRNLTEYGDIGLMLEPVYYRWVNLNGYVSLRSVGVGLGLDITTNFGVAALINTRWGEWQANPFASIYFAF
jgi:hypothetical protein